MAKIRSKDSKAPTSKGTDKPANLKNQNRKKKKKKKILFWKQKIKLAEKRTPKSTDVVTQLPPKTPQEISSNWKAMQELLRQKAASFNSTVTGLDTSSKKKHSAKKEGAQKNKKEHKGGERNGCAERDDDEDIQHKRRKLERPADIWFDDVDPDDIEAALGPEAANVARRRLGIEEKPQQPTEQALVKETAFEGLTRAVAMDCEMVGVGPKGEDSIVARVSLVNQFGKCVYDKYVKATEKVTDYRTAVSGIRPKNLKTGEDFKVVQKEVAEILRGRILVGHALHNDLKILFLDHPKKRIRDTQRYKPFRQQVKSGRPSLKLLCEKLLNVNIQHSEHSSIQDAQAAMRLYIMVKKQWEASLKAPSTAERK